MKVLSWNPETDGIFSVTALVNKLEKSGFLCTRYTYPPGTFFPEHVHEVEKIDAVVQGTFRITAGHQEYILQAGDSIRIPAGTAHSAEVIGNCSVVAIDAVTKT